MSYVVTAPAVLGSVAAELELIAGVLHTANAAAAASTTAELAAASDEVSAAVALLFSGHGQAYQSLSVL